MQEAEAAVHLVATQPHRANYVEDLGRLPLPDRHDSRADPPPEYNARPRQRHHVENSRPGFLVNGLENEIHSC